VDAVLLLHGVGSNFYSSVLLNHLSRCFADHDVMTLRANTRGHDFVSLARSHVGPQRTGAAYETVAHCHHDIRAWSDWLERRGARRIVLIGHSLGAVKALYTMAHHPLDAVAGVVAVSPPRLSCSQFQAGPRSKLFLRTMQRAQTHLDQGHPETMIRVTYPFPLLITAAGFVDKYGPAERYNFLNFAHLLPCPALITFGQEELDSGSVAFAGVPEALARLSSGAGPLQSVTIAAANHLYDGHCEPLAHEILGWLSRGVPRTPHSH
jgi:pimeloyl-ACP methyl ester carboxylesterase